MFGFDRSDLYLLGSIFNFGLFIGAVTQISTLHVLTATCSGAACFLMLMRALR